MKIIKVIIKIKEIKRNRILWIYLKNDIYIVNIYLLKKILKRKILNFMIIIFSFKYYLFLIK